MRFRERTDSADPIDWAIYKSRLDQNCAGTKDYVASTIQSGTYVPDEVYQSMSDVVTPNYHSLVQSGAIVNSPMTQVLNHEVDSLALYNYKFSYEQWLACNPSDWVLVDELNWGNRASSVCMGGKSGLLLGIPAYNEQDLIDQAVNTAWSRVSLDEAQVMVQLGEVHKTVLSVSSIIRRLLKVLKSIKRADLGVLRQEFTAKQLADRYMELRYALRPLMYDMNGVVAALKHEAGSLNDRLTFRASKHATVNDSYSELLIKQNYNNSCGNWKKYAQFEKYATRTVDVRAGVLTQLETLSTLPVWGLANPVEAAWELVPFSFIVDWFLTVGDTLAAWTPDYGLTALASWYVVTDTCYRTAAYTRTWGTMPEGDDENNAISHDYNWTNVFYSVNNTTKTRVPNPRRAILPSVTLNLNCFKLIDLLIIARQLWGRIG